MRRIFQYHARASLRQSSYAAGFFRFKVDPTELFPYPSHKLDTEEWDNIQSLIEQIRSNDKDLNTTGSRIAPEYGGLGLSHTAHALLCEELGTSGGSSALTAIQHASLAHFLLSTVGTKELKGKYLTAMSDGTIFMGWAVRENCGSDLSMNKTEAVLEGGKYVLSGTKVAFFAKSSTHFLVLAKANTQAATEGGPAEVKRSSFFVVPKGETGVSIDETSNTVTFHKSPAVDVIGAIGEGFHDVSIATLTEQYAYAAALLGTLKRVVQELRDAVPDKWAVNTIASCACSMYAMESALYALTANLDLPTEDILFEASLVTAFIQSATNEWLSTLSTATPTSKVLEGCFANARSLLSMMEPTDYLYAVPTCCGIEDCGVAFQGSSTLQMMQSRFARTIGMKERIPLKQIDCSLIDSAIVNFSNAVETTFVRNTTQAQYQQLILNRLGEAASLLYVASATASRAAMCATKRLATAKTEKELASAFIHTAVSRANFLSTECQNTGLTADDSYMRIALELCEDALK